MLQIEKQAKNNTKKQYRYKNTARNCSRNNSNNIYNSSQRFTKSVSDNRVFEEEKKEQIVNNKIYRVFVLRVFTVKNIRYKARTENADIAQAQYWLQYIYSCIDRVRFKKKRSFKKLENKILNLFLIIDKTDIFYKLNVYLFIKI